ncbi:hypothetical protein [Streptomyces bullii]|uniref:Uncharacterized protein n=1 Tax=Streptomyces bullii TaxID=349910 RepID=A0ABW0UYI6_9ACTN
MEHPAPPVGVGGLHVRAQVALATDLFGDRATGPAHQVPDDVLELPVRHTSSCAMPYRSTRTYTLSHCPTPNPLPANAIGKIQKLLLRRQINDGCLQALP